MSQAVAQLPQCAGSVSGFEHVPPQSTSPVPQTMELMPPAPPAPPAPVVVVVAAVVLALVVAEPPVPVEPTDAVPTSALQPPWTNSVHAKATLRSPDRPVRMLRVFMGAIFGILLPKQTSMLADGGRLVDGGVVFVAVGDVLEGDANAVVRAR